MDTPTRFKSFEANWPALILLLRGCRPVAPVEKPLTAADSLLIDAIVFAVRAVLPRCMAEVLRLAETKEDAKSGTLRDCIVAREADRAPKIGNEEPARAQIQPPLIATDECRDRLINRVYGFAGPAGKNDLISTRMPAFIAEDWHKLLDEARRGQAVSLDRAFSYSSKGPSAEAPPSLKEVFADNSIPTLSRADLLFSEPEYIDFPPDVLAQLEQDGYMRTQAGAKGTAEQQAAVRDSGEQTKSVITTCIPIEDDEGIWQRLSETTDAVDQKGKAKMTGPKSRLRPRRHTMSGGTGPSKTPVRPSPAPALPVASTSAAGTTLPYGLEFSDDIWPDYKERREAMQIPPKVVVRPAFKPLKGYHLPGNPHASSSPNPYGDIKEKADHGDTAANEDGSVDDAPGPAEDEHNAPQSTTERLGGEAGGQGAAPESESQLYPPRPYYAFKRLRYVKDPLL
ncbi:hypothetical protein OC834_007577 [Tilletia horrida]|nr:hypothetical protein OC834_007577 [Tilletia horrida]